jgi:hypothetical protein
VFPGALPARLIPEEIVEFLVERLDLLFESGDTGFKVRDAGLVRWIVSSGKRAFVSVRCHRR